MTQSHGYPDAENERLRGDKGDPEPARNQRKDSHPAITANAFDEDRKKALAAGMNGHIAKPFKVETMLEELELALL